MNVANNKRPLPLMRGEGWGEGVFDRATRRAKPPLTLSPRTLRGETGKQDQSCTSPTRS